MTPYPPGLRLPTKCQGHAGPGVDAEAVIAVPKAQNGIKEARNLRINAPQPGTYRFQGVTHGAKSTLYIEVWAGILRAYFAHNACRMRCVPTYDSTHITILGRRDWLEFINFPQVPKQQ